MSKFMKDISGKRFGKLVALYPVEQKEPSNGVYKWMCKCDCGNFHIANSNNLQCNRVKSCGCLRKLVR